MPNEHVSLYDATKALQENLSLLDPKAHKAARNLSIALLGMCSQLDRLSNDVGLLHNKLQPILKSLEEDNSEYRTRFPRTEYDGS